MNITKLVKARVSVSLNESLVFSLARWSLDNSYKQSERAFFCDIGWEDGAESIWYRHSSTVWVHESLFWPVCFAAITYLNELGNNSIQQTKVCKSTITGTVLALSATENWTCWSSFFIMVETSAFKPAMQTWCYLRSYVLYMILSRCWRLVRAATVMSAKRSCEPIV